MSMLEFSLNCKCDKVNHRELTFAINRLHEYTNKPENQLRGSSKAKLSVEHLIVPLDFFGFSKQNEDRQL